MTKSVADHYLLFRSRQAPISMRLCAGLASAKLTLLSRFGSTSGATNSQGLFLLGFHGYIMRRCAAPCWSILTSEGNTDSIGPRPGSLSEACSEHYCSDGFILTR
jgi:hypothetical protein